MDADERSAVVGGGGKDTVVALASVNEGPQSAMRRCLPRCLKRGKKERKIGETLKCVGKYARRG
jgi:hypothetical protein